MKTSPVFFRTFSGCDTVSSFFIQIKPWYFWMNVPNKFYVDNNSQQYSNYLVDILVSELEVLGKKYLIADSNSSVQFQMSI